MRGGGYKWTDCFRFQWAVLQSSWKTLWSNNLPQCIMKKRYSCAHSFMESCLWGQSCYSIFKAAQNLESLTPSSKHSCFVSHKTPFLLESLWDMMTQESTEVQSPHGICQILNRTNFLYLVFLRSFKTPFSLLTQQICSVFSRSSRPIFVLHPTDLFGFFLELQDPYSLLTQHICSVFFSWASIPIFFVDPTKLFGFFQQLWYHFPCSPNKFIQFFFWSSKTQSLWFT